MCEHAELLGCYVRKYDIPSCLFITRHGRTFFIEFKKRCGIPTILELKEIERIRKVKVEVFIVDSVEKGIRTVEEQIEIDEP